MIDPGLIQKGDAVYYVTDAVAVWREVSATPWYDGYQWRINTWVLVGERRVNMPGYLGAVMQVWRDEVEIWNAETALEQQKMF